MRTYYGTSCSAAISATLSTNVMLDGRGVIIHMYTSLKAVAEENPKSCVFGGVSFACVF